MVRPWNAQGRGLHSSEAGSSIAIWDRSILCHGDRQELVRWENRPAFVSNLEKPSVEEPQSNENLNAASQVSAELRASVRDFCSHFGWQPNEVLPPPARADSSWLLFLTPGASFNQIENSAWLLLSNPATSKHEAIVYVVDEADRAALGHISMAITKYWTSYGPELKGIVVTKRDNHSDEILNFARVKKICILSAVQLAMAAAVNAESGRSEFRASLLSTCGGYGVDQPASSRLESA
jgi:hypothetical protein